MKTSELSIKDWVIDSTGEYVRIDGIGCSDYNEIRRNDNLPIRVDDDDDRYLGIINPAQKRTYNEHMEEINPIPITSDILEANGWLYTRGWQNHGRMYIVGNRFKINLINGAFFIWHGCDGYCQKTELYCKYVHELQHALRLCGLNDLADNFVIEKGGK